MSTKITGRAALKSAIKSTASDIRTLRATARMHHVEALRLAEAGTDEARAAATTAAVTGARAHNRAKRLGAGSRLLLVAYAFARRRPLAELEGNRRHARPLGVEAIRTELAAHGLDVPVAELAAWLEGAPMPLAIVHNLPRPSAAPAPLLIAEAV